MGAAGPLWPGTAELYERKVAMRVAGTCYLMAPGEQDMERVDHWTAWTSTLPFCAGCQRLNSAIKEADKA
jgi:hypothetical protein